MSPDRLSDKDYGNTVITHLRQTEGASPRIYTDLKGIPTMGIGNALAVQKSKDTPFVLRDLKDIGAEISGDPDHPYQFSPAEVQLLRDTTAKLNQPDMTEAGRAKAAQALIPVYRSGDEPASNNKFGFALSDQRMNDQAMNDWNDARDSAMDTVREQAAKRGWSKGQTDTYVESLKNSKQDIALTSLDYNNVYAPKATGAMLDGDPATMRQEILYNSNAGNSHGIANRRRAEADLATGTPATWNPQDQQRWNSIESTDAAKAYRNAHPDAFREKVSSLSAEDAAAQNMPLGDYLKQRVNLLEDQPRQKPVGVQVASADTVRSDALPVPVGDLANESDKAPEQATNTDTRIAAMRVLSAQPITDAGKSALLKPVQNWTEGEMKDALNSAQGDFFGWKSGDPMKARLYESVQDWHSHIYGDGVQQYDGGKPVDPQPMQQVPDVPVPHLTKEGEDLWNASRRMGNKIATIAESDGYAPTVKAMQRGINMLNNSLGQPDRSGAWGPPTPQEPLKEDGDYGPKTDFAMKDLLVRHGSAMAESALALGRANTQADGQNLWLP
jgi:hypothetical protein